MRAISSSVPLIGFAAVSGTGKTTLLRALLPLLNARGLRVGVIKHAHHTFDIDVPGKDSYELRRAGATQTLVGSRHRWALVTETPGSEEPRLAELLLHLSPDSLDLVLVEGFKAEAFPKIELHRPALGHPLMCRTDPSIIALATDAPVQDAPSLPLLDLNDPASVVAFIVSITGAGTASSAVVHHSVGRR
ncbi:MAG: molybdopterin-guanine dinucleotide biosynthesis protein B [Thiotrichales bacterium SG8_50]|jgi:molybdopterin-guanine dinucleotide biosynthesis protein B|nr:MAG: molybdopterin-guanine dinucleotide biosynthesis protein B [Thiotrichales bacterium SG8_50]KPL28114.1 MAG: molybdopterin-guanine dinucleotide biosynthesis protein B [Acidithiobacillales bacterium SM1_46]